MSRPRVALVGLLATCLGGCGGEPRYLTVEVSAPGSDPPVFQLRVAVTLEDRADVFLAPRERSGAPLTWPTDLSLELPAGTTGSLRVVVQALDADGATVFDAQASTSAEDTTRLEVALVACAGRTAGPTSIGPTWGLFPADRQYLNRVSLAEGAVVERLSLYATVAGGSGSQAIRGVVYGLGPDQEPAGLLAASEELSFTDALPPGWVDFVLSPPVVVGPGTYGIGIHAGGPDMVFSDAYLVESATMRVLPDPFADGPSDPFGAAEAADATMSLHLVYRGCL